MSDDLPKLPVKGPEDLVKPEKPEVLHGKPVEVTPEPDWQKLAQWTFWDKLAMVFQGIMKAANKTSEFIANLATISASAKWLVLLLVIGGIILVLLRAFHVL